MKHSHLAKTVLGFAVYAMIAANAYGGAMWTNWTSATAGSSGGGSATGSLGGATVSYSGELDTFIIDGTSSIWGPDSTFTGGTVDVSPNAVGDELRLNGLGGGTYTISFDSLVENPLIAFWSLGGGGTDVANFSFIGATPTFEAGGPNALFGGVAITVNGNVVSGIEANGVVQFTGTFSSISWTNLEEEFGSFAFTVGASPQGSAGVPEPASLAIAAGGLSLVALLRRRHGARTKLRCR